MVHLQQTHFPSTNSTAIHVVLLHGDEFVNYRIHSYALFDIFRYDLSPLQMLKLLKIKILIITSTIRAHLHKKVN